MDENKLWEKFCENGSIADYLIYRNCVNSIEKTELEALDKNNSTGACNKGAEHRGVR